MPVYHFGELIPQIDPDAWIAPGVQIIGNARIDALAGIWFGTVMRADNDLIHIGEGSNIQDGCVLHNDAGTPVIIEPYVTVGHQVLLHSCHVGHGSLVGMQSVLMSRSRIGRSSLVAAGSLVTEGKVFPDGVLIMGRPAKAVRELTDDEMAQMQITTRRYIDKAQRYAKALREQHV